MSSSLTSRPTIEDLAERLRHERQGFTMFFDYQIKTFEDWIDWLKAGNPARWGLYYRTGAGKSITSLVMLRLKGYEEVLVIAPPITHTDWHSLANALGMRADTISHAKFRQPLLNGLYAAQVWQFLLYVDELVDDKLIDRLLRQAQPLRGV